MSGEPAKVRGRSPAIPCVMLASLVLFHAVNNWLWLKANVTLLGWDVPGHLGTSFVYNDILRPVSLKTLFEAITWHPNRPPLVYLSAVPLYRLFGVSVDVGTMANVLFLAVLFCSVYGIGRRMGGRAVGLLAAFVVSMLPGIFSISRVFYHELALAALVSLSVYLLLASEGFEKRAASLLFGLSFGLGLLTTRTYLTFIFAPLGLVLLRSATFPSLLRRLKSPKGRWTIDHGPWTMEGVDQVQRTGEVRRTGRARELRDLALAVIAGSALAALWYLPGREIAAGLLLRGWLLPIWAILLAGTIYLLLRRPGPDTNFLSALALGATLASVWYLPRITFVQNLLSFGFGVHDPRERTAGLNRLSTYLYFPIKLVNEHLSLVISLFLVLAVAGLILYLARRGNWWNRLRRADRAWWATALWVIGPYLVLTLSIYRKSRGIVPMLPALALILAAGLLRLPWRRIVPVLIALLVGWGLLQFFVLSYPGAHRLAELTGFRAPVLGESGLFAHGGTVELPAAGETDPAYWIGPDLLQRVEAGRQASGAESASVGLLVNSAHLNLLHLGLLTAQDYPGIRLDDLTSPGPDEPILARVFAQDCLVWNEKDRSGLDEAAAATLDHLHAAPDLFDATFVLDSRYDWPNGDTVLLYRKVRRMPAGVDRQGYAAAAERIAAWSEPGDAILLVPPEQAEALGSVYDGALPVYWLSKEPSPSALATEAALAEMAARHRVVWALFRDEGAADPDGLIEGWLNTHAYRAHSEWDHDLRLVVYGAPAAGPEGEPQHALDLRLHALDQTIRLTGYSLAEDRLEASGVVRLTLFWQVEEGPPSERLTVFAHLLDGQGRLVAQQDSEPAGGSHPTTSWRPGEVIRDPIGILLPPDVAPGEYHLAVGLYRRESGERLPVLGPNQGKSSDQVYLEEAVWVQ